MKKRITFFFLLFIFINILKVSGRLFFVGSFPYLSIIAFPQDINFFRTSYVAYTLSYQSLPWYGDVDDPANRPNDSYVSTDQNITFVKETNDTETSFFKQYGSLSKIEHMIDYLKIKNKLRWYFSVKYRTDSMDSEVDANLRADESGTLVYIPIDYTLTHKFTTFYFMSIIGFKFNKNIPVGIKVGFGKEDSNEPYSLLKTKINGVDVNSKRLFWGWSTVGCNHIFGYHYINGDAWFENDFSIGPLYRYDLQIGFTSGNFRVGSRFRYLHGQKSQYRWVSEGTNSIIEENFLGSYEKQRWIKDSNKYITRLYSNITFIKKRYMKFNTLFFLGYSDYKANNVLAENMDFKNNSTEIFHEYTFEANPNINIYFGRRIIIDTAILFEYDHTKFKNVYDRWNSLMSATKTTYWNTYVYVGDEYYWENFSYAYEDFFDLGWEIDYSMPLYRDKNRLLSMLTMIMINAKFTHMTKYYGVNEDTKDDIVFNVNNKRYNKRREIWLNTTFSLFYKKSKLHLRFDLIEPLIYSKYVSTKVVDANDRVLYNNEKSNQLAIQEGSKLVFSIGYEI